jgi:hypothetical protein
MIGLTTATILTLNDEVHVVLRHAVVLGVDLADVAATVLESRVVQNQNVVAILGEWREFVFFFLPFVLCG